MVVPRTECVDWPRLGAVYYMIYYRTYTTRFTIGFTKESDRGQPGHHRGKDDKKMKVVKS